MENSQYICARESKRGKIRGKYLGDAGGEGAAGECFGQRKVGFAIGYHLRRSRKVTRELGISSLGKSDDGYAT